ncbi:MAG: hypothetical protein ACTSUE_19455 [Promethearchaeota archaeon]
MAGIKFRHTTPSAFNEELHESKNLTCITTWTESRHIVATDSVVFSFDETKYPINQEKIHDFFLMLKIWIDTGKTQCKTILMGLDPGSKKTGIALFLDGIFIEASTIQTGLNLERIEKIIRRLIELYSSPDDAVSKPETIVKIGDGDYLDMKTILNSIESIIKEFDLHVYIVDEFKTNSTFRIQESSFIKISPDERAAINIALRDGTLLHEYHDPRTGTGFSKKQVKKIQHESRNVSSHDGTEHVSIDRFLATRVLLGKITMQDAIKMQKNRR